MAQLEAQVEHYTVSRTTGYILHLREGENPRESLAEMLQAGEIEWLRDETGNPEALWVKKRWDADFLPVLSVYDNAGR